MNDDYKDIDDQIEKLNRDKEIAVTEQDFEKSFWLRQQVNKLKKKKQHVSEWKPTSTHNYTWDFNTTSFDSTLSESERYESLYTLIKTICFRHVSNKIECHVMGHGFIMDRIDERTTHDSYAMLDDIFGENPYTFEELGDDLISRFTLTRVTNGCSWSFIGYELNSLGDEIVIIQGDEARIIKLLNVSGIP